MNFEIINRVFHYQGRAFNVERLETRLPDGRISFYDLVQHNDSVTILPVDQEGNIWFVQQFRMGSMNILLELPAGVLDDAEDPETGAAREVREEIGLSAGKLQKLGEYYLAPGYSTEFMHAFLATDLTPDPLQADDDEFLKVQVIPTKTVYEMVQKGEIKDSKTLAALLLAEKLIR